MFDDTTLIVVGDSFVYGQLGNDLNVETCHARSWVSKLGKNANFKSVINLGEPGGCNPRSVRVLLDYLNEHYNSEEKYLVIVGLSDLHRFEFSMVASEAEETNIYSTICCPYEKPLTDQHSIIPIGPWKPPMLEKDGTLPRLVDYTYTYYRYMAHDAYAEKILKHQLVMLNNLLESLNIKCYFTSTILRPNFLTEFEFLKRKLPVIKYHDNGAESVNLSQFLASKKFKLFPCGHFDHDAYEFLANYIRYQLIRDTWGGKNAIQRS